MLKVTTTLLRVSFEWSQISLDDTLANPPVFEVLCIRGPFRRSETMSGQAKAGTPHTTGSPYESDVPLVLVNSAPQARSLCLRRVLHFAPGSNSPETPGKEQQDRVRSMTVHRTLQKEEWCLPDANPTIQSYTMNVGSDERQVRHH